MVVHPDSAEEVAAVLAACAEARAALVPFGGGTSVVGGVEPLADGFAGAASLDLRRLDAVAGIDRASRTARLGRGCSARRSSAGWGRRGSRSATSRSRSKYSTLGGWIATRSAGQASGGYGRIDDLVEGMRFIAPAGEIDVRERPASAAGPELSELLMGSEGVLGVVCEATVRVRPAPQLRRFEGWSFRSFGEGSEALRVLAQEGAAPDVARLADEAETGLGFALAATGGTAERVVKRYLRMAGHERGCVAIAGFEGSEDDVERRRLRAAALLRGGGGSSLGRRPGDAWLRTRDAGPDLRDQRLGRGVLVDTLETATSWSNLLPLYEAVGGRCGARSGRCRS